MALIIYLALLLCIFGGNAQKTLKFSQQFTVIGNSVFSNCGNVSVATANWYDSINNKSRLVLKGKTFTTEVFDFTAKGDFGVEYSRSSPNISQCLQFLGSSDDPITLKSIIPVNTTGFEYHGTETIGDILCHKWHRLEHTVCARCNWTENETLWVAASDEKAEESDVPVQYISEMKLQKVISQYTNFSTGNIDPHVFDLPEACKNTGVEPDQDRQTSRFGSGIRTKPLPTNARCPTEIDRLQELMLG